MNYKSYPTVKQTPSRLARKHARREVFVFNKKAKAIQRKAERLARRQAGE